MLLWTRCRLGSSPTGSLSTCSSQWCVPTAAAAVDMAMQDSEAFHGDSSGKAAEPVAVGVSCAMSTSSCHEPSGPVTPQATATLFLPLWVGV